MPEVLVIDDDEFILSLIQFSLQEGGFSVMTTADGPQGIELFSRRKPAAVIVDLGLPSMDGLQVVRRIMDLDRTAKVMVITGYPSPAAEEAARSLGARDFVAKPFDPGKLVARVQSLISSRS